MSKVSMNLRIDNNLKKKAETLTNELGISMSAAITLFLKAMIREKGLPFAVTTVSKKERKASKPRSKRPSDEEIDDFDTIDETSLKDAIAKL